VSPLDQLAPRAMAGAFTGLSEDGVITTDLAEKMRKSVGFRNVAIQQYERGFSGQLSTPSLLTRCVILRRLKNDFSTALVNLFSKFKSCPENANFIQLALIKLESVFTLKTSDWKKCCNYA